MTVTAKYIQFAFNKTTTFNEFPNCLMIHLSINAVQDLCGKVTNEFELIFTQAAVADSSQPRSTKI